MKPHGICPQDLRTASCGSFFINTIPVMENSRDWPKQIFFNFNVSEAPGFFWRISWKEVRVAFFPVVAWFYPASTETKRDSCSTERADPILVIKNLSREEKLRQKGDFWLAFWFGFVFSSSFLLLIKSPLKNHHLVEIFGGFKLGYAEVSISSMQCWRPSVGLGITQGQVDGKWKFGYIQPVCNRHHQDDIICLVRDSNQSNQTFIWWNPG